MAERVNDPEPARTPQIRRHGLSKSRLAIFEQCPKRLWLSVHKPELSAESADIRQAFAIGHDVGTAACSLYPDGVMIEGANGLTVAADATKSALCDAPPRPLFEATFIHQGVVVRVDLLLPEEGGWHVVEVKSTTKVRPSQRSDLATQLWVLRGCGVRVSRASIRVIDTSFILAEHGNYRGLFADEPAGVDIDLIVEMRGDMVSAASLALAGDEPDIGVGAHCSDPFPCSFDGYCRRDFPEPPMWPTTILPGVAGKALGRAFAEQGIDDLLQVEANRITHPQLTRIHAVTLSGTAYHDADAIVEETCNWSYPRTFLDFETIAFAIPRWIGTGPYQQVPFQFSAHIDRGDGAHEHHEFLSIDGSDPRTACAHALTSLPGDGAVIAWNASFERSCLKKLAAYAPEYAGALFSLADRLVDLLPVARRHYYHRDMRGSWSIKAVLPTLAPELDYKMLDGAQSGVDAQVAYLEAIGGVSDERRNEIAQGLRAYCRLDTLGMAIALQRLCRAGEGDVCPDA